MISWSILKVFKVFVSGFKLELEPDPEWHVSPELPPWVGLNYLLCRFVFATFFISIKNLLHVLCLAIHFLRCLSFHTWKPLTCVQWSDLFSLHFCQKGIFYAMLRCI